MVLEGFLSKIMMCHYKGYFLLTLPEILCKGLTKLEWGQYKAYYKGFYRGLIQGLLFCIHIMATMTTQI